MSFFTADELPESLSWLPDAWNKQVDELARLRAELAALQTEHNAVAAKYKQKWQQAEVELAALKGRRCLDCAKLTYMDCPVWPAFHRGETVEAIPSDYSCSMWSARAEEGGEE